MNIKNVFKSNQIIIYTIVLMLFTAGYFNYTNKIKENEVETSVQEIGDNGKIDEQDNIVDKSKDNKELEEKEKKEEEENEENNKKSNEKKLKEVKDEDKTVEKIAGIGDATLVSSNDVVEDDYFAKSKIERDAMYSQMKETYQAILNSPNSMESQKEMASVELARINETRNCIMICENLLETKGFKDCIIFVNEGSVSVIVGVKELKQEQIAQIQNIITRELGAIIENIHVSTK